MMAAKAKRPIFWWIGLGVWVIALYLLITTLARYTAWVHGEDIERSVCARPDEPYTREDIDVAIAHGLLEDEDCTAARKRWGKAVG